MSARKRIREKFKEALSSVLPIVLIVILLSFLLVPVPSGIMLTFLAGGAMLIVGMMLFTLGAEISLSPMGEYVGSYMTKTRRIGVVIGLSFLLGLIITISEPDLQVLAQLVPSVPNAVLIFSVAVGVAAFLVLALLRMLFGLPLRRVLLIFYPLVFVLAAFVPESFLNVAFDSGGVTTGPMTVPFIMALGVGVAAIRSDRHAADDSFGLVAMCSIGPILAVLILGMIYHPQGQSASITEITGAADSMELFGTFLRGLPVYIKEIAVSLLPIVLFMAAFQALVLRLSGRKLKRILVGIAYTYIGLVLFLTGANVGFMPAGNLLGQMIGGRAKPLVIPIAMVMGFFIVRAEPAVYVLNKQVEEMTDGGISAASMGMALSIGVAISLGLAMVMVLTGISILWFLIPGYALALGLSFLVPKMHTAIAFDSGGVASGPMTAAFLVPFAQGVCIAVGGDLETDAFGIVAMVAMTPLITIQLMSLYAAVKARAQEKRTAVLVSAYEQLDEDAIIPL